MTTQVTINAHAGWPVKVEAIDAVFKDGRKTDETETADLAIVGPGRIEEFYIHDSRQLLITEMKQES